MLPSSFSASRSSLCGAAMMYSSLFALYLFFITSSAELLHIVLRLDQSVNVFFMLIRINHFPSHAAINNQICAVHKLIVFIC